MSEPDHDELPGQSLGEAMESMDADTLAALDRYVAVARDAAEMVSRSIEAIAPLHVPGVRGVALGNLYRRHWRRRRAELFRDLRLRGEFERRYARQRRRKARRVREGR